MNLYLKIEVLSYIISISKTKRKGVYNDRFKR